MKTSYVDKEPEKERANAARGTGGTPLQLQMLVKFIMRIGRKLREGRLLDPEEIERIGALSAALHGRDPVDFGALSDGRLAAAFSVAPRTIANWHHEGLPAKPDKTHELAACIRWFVSRGGDRPGSRGSSPRKSDEDVKLIMIKRRRQETADRRERGLLVDRRAMENALAERIAVSRTILTSSLERRVLSAPPEQRSAERRSLERDLAKVLLLLEGVWSEPSLALPVGIAPPESAASADNPDPEEAPS